jgi:protein gp37
MQLTRIEWCDESWNPVTGCSPVSRGCQNCYAKLMATRLAAMGKAPWQGRTFSDVLVHPERLEEPLARRKPKTIFCCSMSDLFHDKVTDGQITQVLGTMRLCQRHRFIVLTKRPKRMWEYARKHDLPTNLHLGVSIEDASAAVDRLYLPPHGIKQVISFEPLLGSVDMWGYTDVVQQSVKWVIVGAEQGPGARPMNPHWAYSLRCWANQCGVPYFFKKETKGLHVPPEVVDTREFPWS